MSRIVILKPQAKRAGGLEKTASTLMNAFVERGCEVVWLTTGRPVPPQNVAVHGMEKTSWRRAKRLELFDAFTTSWLQNHKADVVLGLDRCRHQTHIRAGNGVHAAYLEQRAKSEGPLAHLWTRFSPLHRKLLAIEREAFESAGLQKVFTNSEMVRREILERFTVAPEKVEVIHNGVEWNEHAAPFAASFRDRRAEFRLLFVGHGYRRKGLRPLLQGLALLGKSDVILDVVGNDPNTAAFEREAKRLGVRAHFHGPQANLIPFYQRADALAIPSFYDPFANVTVEALSLGLSVVSSKHNGGVEVLTSETGVVIDELTNPESVADALRQIVQRPKTRARAEAIRASVQHLDFPNVLRRFVEGCCG